MRNLIKKILRESNELDWIINTQPTFGQVFKAATENDPRIVVYLSDDDEIEKIDDEAGYHYYTYWSGVGNLESPEDLLELAKDNITGYKDKNDDDWCHFRDVVIKTFFPDMNNNLNESEEDPFKWIRDTQPINYEYLLGKGLHFQPLINNSEVLNRILDLLENIGFEAGHGLRYFDFVEEGIDLEGLYLNPSTNKVTWTSDLYGEDYEEHITDYADRPVEVLDGWRTLEDYI